MCVCGSPSVYGCACAAAGHTASLVSKYRPAMPILTLVIPQLKTESMKWRLEGRAVARQCQISRSLFPVLAAPSPSGQPSSSYSNLDLGLKNQYLNTLITYALSEFIHQPFMSLLVLRVEYTRHMLPSLSAA